MLTFINASNVFSSNFVMLFRYRPVRKNSENSVRLDFRSQYWNSNQLALRARGWGKREYRTTWIFFIL